MKLYADATPRFATQLALDALLVAWVVLWIWVGTTVHDGTMALAGPGERTAASATSLSESMGDAGSYLQGVPLVGDGIAAPFQQASDASQALAETGESTVRAVERLALWLGLSIAVIPILVVASRYLPGRVRFAREAAAAQQYVDGPADLELFALRAMAHQPLHVLNRVTDDPVGAWRRGDADVIDRLARLELADHGLRLPAGAR
ncbi:hypothetical protein GGQ22_05645 [Nocardioides sp. zg-579]|uniref:Uncharacterized protein n=1 Tax=Nocardioides marmotae TaxID=2663857 RepID=A0A6I3J869_9ACTN|nr:hypothetical protein [Nocardioides marmotae]MCR6030922.1 hypothetical protein [Gordonia jinghuaiqii]MTB94559.1 hypothetical protein [Nocardioides marmotae]QKE01427.1 hypothetical protein HPC71_10340 [Nocardioides marmotae]